MKTFVKLFGMLLLASITPIAFAETAQETPSAPVEQPAPEDADQDVASDFSSFWGGFVGGQVRKASGLTYKGFRFSPYFKTGPFYDSNVPLRKNGKGSAGWNYTPGADISYVGNDWGLTLGGFFSYDQYFDSKFDPEWTASESASIYKEKGNWRVMLAQSYQRNKDVSFGLVNDSSFDGYSRMRDTIDVSAAVSWKAGPKTTLSLTAGYQSYWYEDEQYSGYDTYNVAAELARRVTEKTDFLVNAGLSMRDSDLLAKMTYQYSLMAGLGSRISEKIGYRIMAGGMYYQFENNRGKSDDTFAPTFYGSLVWQLNRKWALTWSLNSGFTPSTTAAQADGYRLNYGTSLGVVYAMTRRLQLRADGIVTLTNYQGSWGPQYDEWGDSESVRLSAAYELARHVFLFGSFKYYINNTGIQDYDQYRADMGVTLRY